MIFRHFNVSVLKDEIYPFLHRKTCPLGENTRIFRNHKLFFFCDFLEAVAGGLFAPSTQYNIKALCFKNKGVSFSQLTSHQALLKTAPSSFGLCVPTRDFAPEAAASRALAKASGALSPKSVIAEQLRFPWRHAGLTRCPRLLGNTDSPRPPGGKHRRTSIDCGRCPGQKGSPLCTVSDRKCGGGT